MMKLPILSLVPILGLSLGSCASTTPAPLPSWNDAPARTAILDFVEQVCEEGGPGFVPRAERVAVFDNDGTLWAEQPAYFQLLFAIERIQAMASDHPDWATTQPFQAAIEGDMHALAASGEEGLLEIIAASHAGMTPDEFKGIVREWVEAARHPTTDRPYTEMVYQPMLELLEYLRANDFDTYIVSGGGVTFMRAFAEEVYGVPPEQTIGSTIETTFELDDTGARLMRMPGISYVDDKAGKPIRIQDIIGRRPIAAFGNSDGDLQMLQWTAAGSGPRFCLIVHHTDPDREWAYDRDSHIGRLDKALEVAAEHDWTVVDMGTDWRVIHPD